MTLHDQLAVAEAARPGEFFSKKETLPLIVDDKGYTRIDKARGKDTVVCLEPKRDAVYGALSLRPYEVSSAEKSPEECASGLWSL